MPLSALATMIADDVIVALQAFPVGFGGGAMIQVALEHASKQLPTTGVEELLDFAMVKVLGRGVVQGRHHVGECFEGTGKLFPFVDGGVCLGHEDVSFEYVDVGFSDTYYGDVSLAIPNLYNSLKSINFHIVLKEPHPLSTTGVDSLCRTRLNVPHTASQLYKLTNTMPLDRMQ